MGLLKRTSYERWPSGQHLIYVTLPVTLWRQKTNICCHCPTTEVAVSQDKKLVIHLSESWWFDPQNFHSVCVLGHDTEPQISPDCWSISCEGLYVFLISSLALYIKGPCISSVRLLMLFFYYSSKAELEFGVQAKNSSLPADIFTRTFFGKWWANIVNPLVRVFRWMLGWWGCW